MAVLCEERRRYSRPILPRPPVGGGRADRRWRDFAWPTGGDGYIDVAARWCSSTCIHKSNPLAATGELLIDNAWPGSCISRNGGTWLAGASTGWERGMGERVFDNLFRCQHAKFATRPNRVTAGGAVNNASKININAINLNRRVSVGACAREIWCCGILTGMKNSYTHRSFPSVRPARPEILLFLGLGYIAGTHTDA